MRIAFLSVSAEMGGSEASLLQLVTGIRRLHPGWELFVIVPREGPLAQRAHAAGADVRVVGMPEALARFGESTGGVKVAQRGAALLGAASSVRAYVRALSSSVADIDPAVVHSNGLKMHVLASRAMPRDRPIVWHMHEYLSNRPLSRRLLKAFRTRPRAVVANSQSVAADLRVALGIAPVTTIYNAVDLTEFHPQRPAADLDAICGLPPSPAGAVRVGLVATFGRWKGHATFMRAIAALERRPEVRAYIVGGPLYDTAGSQHTREELEDEARRLGLAGRLGFTGFLDRPSTALRALDVVVHASTQPEPFGLVIAEGMACGRAVIASAGGGAAELVRNGIDALTHVPGDAASLASAIERLVADAPLRARLGDEARMTAERRFATESFAGAFARLYEQVHEDTRAVAL